MMKTSPIGVKILPGAQVGADAKRNGGRPRKPTKRAESVKANDVEEEKELSPVPKTERRGQRVAARKPAASPVVESTIAHTHVHMDNEEPSVDLCPPTTLENDTTSFVVDGFRIDTFADAEAMERAMCEWRQTVLDAQPPAPAKLPKVRRPRKPKAVHSPPLPPTELQTMNAVNNSVASVSHIVDAVVSESAKCVPCKQPSSPPPPCIVDHQSVSPPPTKMLKIEPPAVENAPSLTQPLNVSTSGTSRVDPQLLARLMGAVPPPTEQLHQQLLAQMQQQQQQMLLQQQLRNNPAASALMQQWAARQPLLGFANTAPASTASGSFVDAAQQAQLANMHKQVSLMQMKKPEARSSSGRNCALHVEIAYAIHKQKYGMSVEPSSSVIQSSSQQPAAAATTLAQKKHNYQHNHHSAAQKAHEEQSSVAPAAANPLAHLLLNGYPPQATFGGAEQMMLAQLLAHQQRMNVQRTPHDLAMRLAAQQQESLLAMQQHLATADPASMAAIVRAQQQRQQADSFANNPFLQAAMGSLAGGGVNSSMQYFGGAPADNRALRPQLTKINVQQQQQQQQQQNNIQSFAATLEQLAAMQRNNALGEQQQQHVLAALAQLQQQRRML